MGARAGAGEGGKRNKTREARLVVKLILLMINKVHYECSGNTGWVLHYFFTPPLLRYGVNE